MNTSISLCERVLNVADPNDPQAISKAHFALTGERVSADKFLEDFDQLKILIRQVPGEDGPYKLHPDQAERFVAGLAIQRLFQDSEPYGNVNILNGWPLYQDLYIRFRRLQPEGQLSSSPRSLLLGSLSALSSKAFVAMSQDVYGTSPGAAHIIDPVLGKSRKLHGTVVQASALDLPFKSDSVDIVQSHALLHMILKPAESSVADATQQLFREAFRVMRPGGNLFLYETVPNFQKEEPDNPSEENSLLCKEFKKHIHTSLEDAGFTVDTIEDAWRMSGDFLFDPSRRFDAYDRTPFRRAIMIAAFKEPSLGC